MLNWFAEKSDGGREVTADEVKCLETSSVYVLQGNCINPELCAEDDVSAQTGVSELRLSPPGCWEQKEMAHEGLLLTE